MRDAPERQIPYPPLYAERPRPRILKRPAVVLAGAVAVASAAGLMIWNARYRTLADVPQHPAAAMTGWGTTALDRGYGVDEAQPGRKPEESKDPGKAIPKPRGHDVLWGRNGKGDRKDQFDDPNQAMAQREVETWSGTPAQAAAPAGMGTLYSSQQRTFPELAGCVVKDGTTIEAGQRGGVVQILRPVYGRDYERKEECVAIRAGSTLKLEPRGQGSLCATRLDLAGGGIKPLGCWPVFDAKEGSSPRGAIFYVRVESDIAFEV
jgi:hypothetical protein